MTKKRFSISIGGFYWRKMHFLMEKFYLEEHAQKHDINKTFTRAVIAFGSS